MFSIKALSTALRVRLMRNIESQHCAASTQSIPNPLKAANAIREHAEHPGNGLFKNSARHRAKLPIVLLLKRKWQAIFLQTALLLIFSPSARSDTVSATPVPNDSSAARSTLSHTPAEDYLLSDVEVNAGRLESKQFDTPAATYAIGGSDITKSGNQVNLSDALNLAPGVVSLNRNNYAQDVQISVRGFGARTSFGLRGIRLITDDIPATIPDGQGQASTVSLTSADRIEVLSGPLAQLYGNSSGAVIQTYTKEAGLTPTGQVQAFFGSYGMQRSDWQASERLGEHSETGVVADYSTFKTNGWRQNSAAERNQLNSVITYDPQADTRFKVVINSFNMPLAQDPLGLTMSQFKTNAQQAGTNALLDETQKTVKQDQIGLVMQQKLSSTTEFQARIYDGIRDTNQAQASSCDPSLPTCDPNKYPTTGSQIGSWIALQRSFSGLGLQLKGKELTTPLPWEWTIGSDYDKSSENRQTGKTSYGSISSTTAYLENVATNNDLFAQANIFLNDHWTLVTGVRNDHVVITNYNFTTPSNGGSNSFNSTNPVIGLTWHLREDLNLYTNTGLGFETPTTTETAYSLPTPLSGLPPAVFNAKLSAAESHSYEIGAKWLPTPSTQINTAWFLINTTNDIVTAYTSGGQTVYQNAAQTSREGLEWSLKDTSATHFKENVSFTYMRAQYDTNYYNASNVYQAVAGNALPGVPKESVYTALGWSERGYKQTTKAPLPGAELELDLSGRSTVWANDANSSAGYAAGYGVIDLKMHERIAFGQSTLDTYVNINNAANRTYIGSVIVNQASSGYFEPGLPRNWVLGLKFTTPL